MSIEREYIGELLHGKNPGGYDIGSELQIFNEQHPAPINQYMPINTQGQSQVPIQSMPAMQWSIHLPPTSQSIDLSE